MPVDGGGKALHYILKEAAYAVVQQPENKIQTLFRFRDTGITDAFLKHSWYKDVH
jgi:hypothetical protein